MTLRMRLRQSRVSNLSRATRLFLQASALIFTFYMTSACNVKSKRNEVDSQLSAEEQKAFKLLKEEIDVGRNMAGRLLAYYGQVKDPKLSRYINLVGNFVARSSPYTQRKFMFAILDSENVNAFAAPGGYIFVSVGALRLARNEAELAAILAHEITHVGKQHMLRTLEGFKEEDINKLAEADDAASKSPQLAARRRIVPDKESKSASTLTRYIAGISGQGLDIIKASKAGMSVMFTQGMDHEFEFEADTEGTRYLTQAGYKPTALMSFLKRMARAKGYKNSVFSKTHPSIQDRLAKIQQVLDALEADSIVGATGRKRFRRMKKLLPKLRQKQNKLADIRHELRKDVR